MVRRGWNRASAVWICWLGFWRVWASDFSRSAGRGNWRGWSPEVWWRRRNIPRRSACGSRNTLLIPTAPSRDATLEKARIVHGHNFEPRPPVAWPPVEQLGKNTALQTFGQLPSKKRFYCLSKTTTLLTSRPCASLPFHVEVRVFPSFETTEVIVISTWPPFFC